MHNLAILPSALPLPLPDAGMEVVERYGEVVVISPRGDSVRVPFFRNATMGDTNWVVPMVVFWHVLVQEPVMSKGEWTLAATNYSSRAATAQEVAKLHSLMFLPTSATHDLMVPLDQMVQCLEQLSLTYHRLEATMRGLETIQATSSDAALAHGAAMGDFAQPAPCTLTTSQLKEAFSLVAAFEEYLVDENSLIQRQVRAAWEGFFSDPPVGSGLVHPVGAETFDIWWDSAQQYLGYLRMFEGLEPSLEHLRSTTLLAKFYSFRLAKGNSWNTMLLEFTNLWHWFPFVFYPGNFPGMPAVPDSERRGAERWMKEITARARAESKKPENRVRRQPQAHLAQVWNTQERGWQQMEQEYEVRCLPMVQGGSMP